jgi:hypothetical protein
MAPISNQNCHRNLKSHQFDQLANLEQKKKMAEISNL